MKIEQGPFQEISNLLPQFKEKVLAGRFYHCKRVFVIKTNDGYLAATLTIFERFKAALLQIFGKDYTLKGKKVTFVPNSKLEKLIPAAIPSAKAPKFPAPAAVMPLQPAGAPAAGPGNAPQPVQPAVAAAVVPKVANPAPQAPVVAAAVPANVPQPAQPVAPPPGIVPQAAQQAPVVAAAVPANVPQPAQPVAPSPGIVPQQPVQNLSKAEIERIVKRGFPLSQASVDKLEALVPQFDVYIKDRQYQEKTFNNKNADITLIGCADINKPKGLDANEIQIYLRLLVLKGRIAAFAPSRAGYRIFEKEDQIVLDSEYRKNRENIFTKDKLLEIDQHMSQVRFPLPPTHFSAAQMTRFQEVTKQIEQTQFVRIQCKDSKAGKACDLRIGQFGSNEVMDFLTKTNVIHAWNYFQTGNSLLVKFAPTDMVENPGAGLGLQAWRDAALIQREEDFQRNNRITIHANDAFRQFKQTEFDRLNKIVELLNKRVAYGQPSGLDRKMEDEKLLKWLQDQKHIVDYKANNAIAPFSIYVKEEDRNP